MKKSKRIKHLYTSFPYNFSMKTICKQKLELASKDVKNVDYREFNFRKNSSIPDVISKIFQAKEAYYYIIWAYASVYLHETSTDLFFITYFG